MGELLRGKASADIEAPEGGVSGDEGVDGVVEFAVHAVLFAYDYPYVFVVGEGVIKDFGVVVGDNEREVNVVSFEVEFEDGFIEVVADEYGGVFGGLGIDELANAAPVLAKVACTWQETGTRPSSPAKALDSGSPLPRTIKTFNVSAKRTQIPKTWDPTH